MTNAFRELEMAKFMQNISENPPQLPYESTLIPMLFKVTKETSKASIDDLTRLVERSQKLATLVLSIANSPAFACGKVSSLKRAVSVLGFNEVRTIVIAAGASAAIGKNRLPVNFKGLEIWQHQILTAYAAKVLAEAMKSCSTGNRPLIEPDEAYTAGLLHDIGKIFLASYSPDVWQAVEAKAQVEDLSFYEAELDYWGLHHGTIASVILRVWQLPGLLSDMIEWHHNPGEALTHRRETHLLAAANLIAHLGIEGEKLSDEVVELLPPDADHEYIGIKMKEHIESGQYKELAEALY